MSQRDPWTLFSLVPANQRATDVVMHVSNGHLMRFDAGTYVLDVGQVRSMSGADMTLATLGRNGDVFVEGSMISKIQCSFELEGTSSFVMFYDRSHGQTSQVFGDNVAQFVSGRPRRLALPTTMDITIGMGGRQQDYVRFRLRWYVENPAEAMREMVKNGQAATRQENPRLARTAAEADTVLPSQRQTRIHTHVPEPKLRYQMGEILGAGQYGSVHSAFN